MESAGLIKSVIKSDPWEKFGVAGHLCTFSGVASLIGFKVSGFGFDQTQVWISLFLILIGGVYYFVSYKLKQRKDIALDRRKSDRVVSEPTEGDQIFLKQFREAGGKVSAKELNEFVTPHDKKKNAKEKEATIASLRMTGWIDRGKCLEYGNTYYTREEFERSQKDMTVIQ